MTLLEKRIVGTIFLLMGVVGVFLPLKPDVIFILLGSALLGSNNRLVMKAQRTVRKHFHRRKPSLPQLKRRRRKKL